MTPELGAGGERVRRPCAEFARGRTSAARRRAFGPSRALALLVAAVGVPLAVFVLLERRYPADRQVARELARLERVADLESELPGTYSCGSLGESLELRAGGAFARAIGVASEDCALPSMRSSGGSWSFEDGRVRLASDGATIELEAGKLDGAPALLGDLRVWRRVR